MIVNNINIPNEIINLILLSITDNKTYLNCRLVNKEWYLKLKNIKKFTNNKLISITKFNENNIKTYDLEDRVIKEVLFLPYGNYIINHFFIIIIEKIKKKIIHTAPYKTEELNYQGEVIFMKTINDIENKNISYVNYPFCTIS